MKVARAGNDAAAAAASAIRLRLGLDSSDPELGIVLGSGLGVVADRLTDRRSMSYAEIPGFAVPAIAGHDGAFHVGSLSARFVAVLAGRVHLYEGHSGDCIAHLVRTLAAMGVRRLLLCNASGGIDSQLAPGSIALVSDHVNLTWRNPLTGYVMPGQERFPDMSAPYDHALCDLMRSAARATGISLGEAVYACTTGPSYETPSEVRMLARIGAGVVGMSTIPEVIVARALGMKCVALSCVTNRAAGLSAEPLSHDDVLRVAHAMSNTMTKLIAEFVRML